MNIQPSLIIWTVICFLLLYFILKYLLFGPVLSVLDKRAEKTKGAMKLREDAERERLLLEETARAEAEAKKAEALRLSREKAEKIRMEGKQALEDAKKERINTVEDYREKTAAELKTDIEAARPELDGIAQRFLTRLYADRD